ncbi:MAG: M20/M25/M40 family metallo-hydrolase [Chitinophagaceae bacterium]|nr:M20/M25/M40 family metallo-hydrolase [Chitinophagaceae bacterium]
MKALFTIIVLLQAHFVFSQSNIICTNPAAELVMTGNYDPANYTATVIVSHPDSITAGLAQEINADSLHSYIEKLGSFHTRNSGADTVSDTKGIGAARRWMFQKFQEFSTVNNNRLLPSYLQFDLAICNAGRHKNIFAVLPGMDTSDHSIIIIESHMDSRCEVLCDTACLAQGSDDNGSGTALIMELARVMSRYSFNRTIVFLANTAEEQGLYGSEAFADYVQQKGIPVKAVMNNDIVGGILCGETSSAPSCSPFGAIDSTQVRLFSYGGFNSPHKGLARFIKLQYKEQLLSEAAVPMTISLMTAEDRTGRGGDHIPFREHGFTAMRFTAANENGNANVAAAGYSDNQHTSRDVIGYDTDGDMVIDSFLVDFNYLARNTLINGTASAMAAIGPKTPTFQVSVAGNEVTIQINADQSYPSYRVGVRSLTYDWDSVYTFYSSSGTLYLPASSTYYMSTATVDSNDVESLFSGEIAGTITAVNDPASRRGIQLLPAYPNPSDETVMITVNVLKAVNYQSAQIRITDMNGALIKELPIKLNMGINEVLYHHGYQASGTYFYQLVIDGNLTESRKIIFEKG